jgi:hypothetical protein
VTPKEVRIALNEAARTNNPTLALSAAKEFSRQGLWTSTSHFQPIQLTGSEVLRTAQFPGMCVVCNRDFPPGTEIRWRSRAAAHTECWDEFMERKAA